jgi:hypothetical protein
VVKGKISDGRRDDRMTVVEPGAGVFRGDFFRLLHFACVILLLSLIALLAMAGDTSQRYIATAKIIVGSGKEAAIGRFVGHRRYGESLLHDHWIDSRIELVESQEVAARVIGGLGLAGHPELREPLGRQRLNSLLFALGLSATPPAQASADHLLQRFRARLSAGAPENSRVIAIRFWAYDPGLAQAALDAVAENFVAIANDGQVDIFGEGARRTKNFVPSLDRSADEGQARIVSRAGAPVVIVNNQWRLRAAAAGAIAALLLALLALTALSRRRTRIFNLNRGRVAQALVPEQVAAPVASGWHADHFIRHASMAARVMSGAAPESTSAARYIRAKKDLGTAGHDEAKVPGFDRPVQGGSSAAA